MYTSGQKWLRVGRDGVGGNRTLGPGVQSPGAATEPTPRNRKPLARGLGFRATEIRDETERVLDVLSGPASRYAPSLGLGFTLSFYAIVLAASTLTRFCK